MIRMFHATTREAADSILAGGFRDGEGFYKFDPAALDGPMRGVWLSREPFCEMDGAKGHYHLEVILDMTEAELAEYACVEEAYEDPQTGEWIEHEDPEPHEWLLPAAVVNARGRVRLLADDEY